VSRPIRVLLISIASVAVAAVVAACGTEKIQVPASDPDHAGAVLFSERCSGCHTLDYAATHGSAANPRTREAINGPNFNVRCERPVQRVLYAIENGGFSGAYMPQNIVVGQDARAVSEFVSKYAGRKAPIQPGQVPCVLQPIGTLPPPARGIGALARLGATSGGSAAATTPTTASGGSSTSAASGGSSTSTAPGGSSTSTTSSP
jgi:mono/diheme cytochrome c family protein